MNKDIYIIGIGMGNLSCLTERAKTLLEEAELIIGATRMIKEIQAWHSHFPEFIIEYFPDKIVGQIQQSEKKRIVVAMSGDSGFYSGAKKLFIELEKAGIPVQIEPGISSLAYFASRLKLPWEDIKIVSLHGNTENLSAILRKHEKVFAITQGQTEEICKELTEAGFGDISLYVGKRLSYPEEEIIKTTPRTYKEKEKEPLTVLLFIREKEERFITAGIPDNVFIRGNTPMTKSEIRAIILSKLAVKETDIIYDIGAGTGSVSVELAIAACRGKVYAIEYQQEALMLIQENKKRFGCNNLEIIPGMAPEAIEGLLPADIVFIGGTKGNLLFILKQIIHQKHNVRIAISAVTLETISEVFSNMEQLGIQIIDASQIAVTKLEKVGNYHMMRAQNPIFLVIGQYSCPDKTK